MIRINHQLRRWIVIGTPLLTAILLLFHPLPDPSVAQATLADGSMDAYTMLAPMVNRFLIVHLFFALALVLLGVTIMLLLSSVRGIAAMLSRISALPFVVTYIIYETIVGTGSALLVRGAAALSAADQEGISRAVNRIFSDPLLGDGPSALSLVAYFSWVMTVILAAVALRGAGKSLAPCVLLASSCIFFVHASPLGPLGMIFLLIAVVMLERERLPRKVRTHGRAPLLLSRRRSEQGNAQGSTQESIQWQLKASR